MVAFSLLGSVEGGAFGLKESDAFYFWAERTSSFGGRTPRFHGVRQYSNPPAAHGGLQQIVFATSQRWGMRCTRYTDHPRARETCRAGSSHWPPAGVAAVQQSIARLTIIIMPDDMAFSHYAVCGSRV